MKIRILLYSVIILFFSLTGSIFGATEDSSNTFFGTGAGTSITTGEENNFIGAAAGYTNTTGSANNFIGYYSGYTNTTGSANNFIGAAAGQSNTIGLENTFIGDCAGRYNTIGSYNNFIGAFAGQSNTIGNKNTFLGYQAGFSSVGNKNVFIGFKAGFSETGSHKLYIANNATTTPLIYGDFFNSILRINGNLGIGVTPSYPIETEAGAYVTTGGVWTNASSREYKDEIETLTMEEAFYVLEGLNPVKFVYKKDKTERHVGFIAEDVPDLVATHDRKGLSSMDVVAVLTRVVQKQQMALQEQQKINAALRSELNEIKKRVR